MPGRWCENDTEWLVCYRDWLVPISGWAAALAAAALIAFENWKLNQSLLDEQRSIRMRIASDMAALFDQCETIVMDLRNWLDTDTEMGRPHKEIPLPKFTEITGIEALSEAEDLFGFVRNLQIINGNARLHDSLQSEELFPFVRVQAAAEALRAAFWRNLLGTKVG